MNKDQTYYTKKYKQHGRANKRCIINGLWFNPELNRYVDYGRGRRRYSKYLKRLCNKRLRHIDVDGGREKGHYRKLTEYWWELY